jgi:hypothetical protein
LQIESVGSTIKPDKKNDLLKSLKSRYRRSKTSTAVVFCPDASITVLVRLLPFSRSTTS